MKKILALCLALMMALSLCSFAAAAEAPIKISIYYSDNSTLPYRDDWRTISYLEEKYNVDLVFEPIPMTEYATKVTNVLNNQGDDTPDVILGTSTSGGRYLYSACTSCIIPMRFSRAAPCLSTTVSVKPKSPSKSIHNTPYLLNI